MSSQKKQESKANEHVPSDTPIPPIRYATCAFFVASFGLYPFACVYFGWPALVYWLFHTFFMIAVDFGTSKQPWKNSMIAEKAGYGKGKQILLILNVYSGEGIVLFLILRTLYTDMICPGVVCDVLGAGDLLSEFSFTWFTPFKAVIFMFLGDLAFILMHQYFLHGPGSKHHVLHHLLTQSTMATVYLFDYLDFWAELIPAVTVTLICQVIFHDSAATFLTFVLVHLWYFGFDHDDTVKNGHWYHHKHINQNYSAYIVSPICNLLGIDLDGTQSAKDPLAGLYVTDDKIAKKMSGRTFSLEEVAKHSTEDDLWITFGSNVYDVTGFLHPGGKGALLKAAGGPVDELWDRMVASAKFDHLHHEGVQKALSSRLVGLLKITNVQRSVGKED